VTTRRKFAITALTLGAAAPLARSPFPRHDGTIDVDELARLVERGEDHVDALELAAWIRERRPGLRVVDLRRAEQFDDVHIPTAENISIGALSETTFGENETIVLYSEGGAHAGQAWVFLRALGHERVFFLRAGIYEWNEHVMNPTLARDATDRERAEFAKAAALSEYFGGSPQRDVPRSQQGTTLRELRRRGC
jgi:rhodanese-related sulfurtransferase